MALCINTYVVSLILAQISKKFPLVMGEIVYHHIKYAIC
jgi:hypothetical protein